MQRSFAASLGINYYDSGQLRTYGRYKKHESIAIGGGLFLLTVTVVFPSMFQR